MADKSREPEDNVTAAELRRQLAAVKKDLLADRKAGERAQTKAEEGRAKAAQQESRARKTARTADSSADTLDAAERVQRASQATERTEASITEHAKAQRRTIEAADRVQKAALFEERARTARARRGRVPGLGPATGPVGPDLNLREQQIRSGVVSDADIQRTGESFQKQAVAADKASKATDKKAAVERSATLANTNFTNSISRFNQEANLSEPVYTRNGALTTEFISAAAKGQVTIKELGRQVALTIGKFAGWTLAASATYGAARAIGVLGAGAIQGLDAVNKLSRVASGDFDHEKAQQQLRAASTKFNLPLDEVGEAAFGSAKVFKNQDDIFKGTEAALFAVKVGELDAGTATQALTAIINGLGGSADDLGPIFDKINNLTNNFGGNVGQLTVGLSKSVGAFHNAGGGVEYLLSLLQTGARVTSFTATEIGTALARTSERLQQPVRRVKVAALLGISEDDAGDVEKVFETVFQRIREGASKQEVAQFASTIATPQLATRLIPIFNRESLFRQIQGEATTEQSQGSSERELAKVKKAASEQVKAAGIALANLGSALAQSGALDPLLAIAKGVVEILKAATLLVDVFNELPKPLRTAAIFMAQIAAASALAKRFDVGGSIARQFPHADGSLPNVPFSRSPRAIDRANLLQSIETQRSFLQEERNRLNVQGARSSVKGRDHERQAKAILGNLDDPEQLDEEAFRDYNRHMAGANRAAEEAADLTREAEDRRKEDVELQRKHRNVRRRIRRGEDVQDAAINEGLGDTYVPVDQDRVSNTQSVLAGDKRQQAQEKARATRTRRRAPFDFSAKTAVEAEQAAAKELQNVERESGKLGVSGRLFSGALRGGGGAVKSLPGVLRNIGGGLKGLAGGLLAALGPLDLALAGALITYELIQSGKKQLDDAEKLRAAVSDPAEIRKAAHKELGDKSALDKFEGSYFHSPDEIADEQARKNLSQADALGNAQNSGRLLSQSDIRKRLKERIADAKTGAEKDAAIVAAREEADQSFLSAFGAGKKGTAAQALTKDIIRQAGAAIADGAHSLQERLDALAGAEEVAAFTLKIRNKIRTDGTSKKNTAALAGAANSLREQAANEPDAAKQEALLNEADELEAALLEDATKRLDGLLASSQTPEQAGRARRSFLRSAQRTRSGRAARAGKLEDNDSDNRRKRFDLRISLRKDQDELDSLDAQREPLIERDPDDILGGINALGDGKTDKGRAKNVKAANIRARIKRKLAQIASLSTSITSDSKAAEDLRKQLGLTKAAFEELRRGIQRDQFEQEQASFDVHTALLQSQTSDPVVAAKIAASRAAENLTNVRRAFKQGIVQRDAVEQALTLLNESNKQSTEAAATAAKDLIGAKAELAKSKTTDPVKQAQIDEQRARDLAKFAITAPEKIQAKADIRNAHQATLQAGVQAKVDDIDFNLEFEKITRDEAIRQYEQILKGHNLSKQVRRDLLRKLKALKEGDGDGGELELGNIKLPTAYEVRRLIDNATGRSAPALSRTDVSTLNQSNGGNTVNINVNGPQDYGELGRVLEEHVSGTAKGMSRAGLYQ